MANKQGNDIGIVRKYLPKFKGELPVDIDKIPDADLFEFFDDKASLYFDFLAEKCVQHFKMELKYFSKVRVIIFLNIKNMRLACEGVKKLSQEWANCMDALFDAERLKGLGINLKDLGIELRQAGEVLLTNYKKMNRIRKLMRVIK